LGGDFHPAAGVITLRASQSARTPWNDVLGISRLNVAKMGMEVGLDLKTGSPSSIAWSGRFQIGNAIRPEANEGIATTGLQVKTAQEAIAKSKSLQGTGYLESVGKVSWGENGEPTLVLFLATINMKLSQVLSLFSTGVPKLNKFPDINIPATELYFALPSTGKEVEVFGTKFKPGLKLMAFDVPVMYGLGKASINAEAGFYGPYISKFALSLIVNKADVQTNLVNRILFNEIFKFVPFLKTAFELRGKIPGLPDFIGKTAERFTINNIEVSGIEYDPAKLVFKPPTSVTINFSKQSPVTVAIDNLFFSDSEAEKIKLAVNVFKQAKFDVKALIELFIPDAVRVVAKIVVCPIVRLPLIC